MATFKRAPARASKTRAPKRAAKTASVEEPMAEEEEAAPIRLDGRRLSRRIEFTPRLTEHIRQRYEEAGEGPDVIARGVGVAKATIQRLARERGWTRAAQGPRDLSPAAQLEVEARALAASSVDAPSTLTPISSLQGGGEKNAAPPEQEAAQPVQEAVPIDIDEAIERLLRLVSREIGVYENLRATLKGEPQPQRAALKTAHNLASLTSTLDTLRRMRAGQIANNSHDDSDDIPTDIDALRDALARRIEAFMASRPDDGDAGGPESEGADGA